MHKNLTLLNIPFEEKVYYDGQTWCVRENAQPAVNPIVQVTGRKMVVVDMDGFQQPFYLSSGAGGKKDVPAGKWYPFFGIGDDGWINKTGGALMARYYDSDHLKQVGECLDNAIGDIRDHVNIPSASPSSTSHVDFINTGLNATDNGAHDTKDIVLANIDAVKIRLQQSWQHVKSVALPAQNDGMDNANIATSSDAPLSIKFANYPENTRSLDHSIIKSFNTHYPRDTESPIVAILDTIRKVAQENGIKDTTVTAALVNNGLRAPINALPEGYAEQMCHLIRHGRKLGNNEASLSGGQKELTQYWHSIANNDDLIRSTAQAAKITPDHAEALAEIEGLDFG